MNGGNTATAYVIRLWKSGSSSRRTIARSLMIDLRLECRDLEFDKNIENY